MTRLPILETAKAAVRFQLTHWRRLWGVGLAFWPFGVLQVLGEGEGEASLFFKLISLPFVIVCLLIGYAALMRIALADEHPDHPAFRPGPGGLQFRGTEWRLLGATVLVWATLLGCFLVVVLVVGAVGRLTAAFGGASFSYWGVLFAFPALLYLGLRLSLAGAATVDRGRVQVWRTWPITQGQVLRLLAINLLIGLLAMVEAGAVAFVGFTLNEGLGAAFGNSDLAIWLFLAGMGLIVTLVIVVIQLPLLVGAASYAYRMLRVEGEDLEGQALAEPSPA